MCDEPSQEEILCTCGCPYGPIAGGATWFCPACTLQAEPPPADFDPLDAEQEIREGIVRRFRSSDVTYDEPTHIELIARNRGLAEVSMLSAPGSRDRVVITPTAEGMALVDDYHREQRRSLYDWRPGETAEDRQHRIMSESPRLYLEDHEPGTEPLPGQIRSADGPDGPHVQVWDGGRWVRLANDSVRMADTRSFREQVYQRIHNIMQKARAGGRHGAVQQLQELYVEIVARPDAIDCEAEVRAVQTAVQMLTAL